MEAMSASLFIGEIQSTALSAFKSGNYLFFFGLMILLGIGFWSIKIMKNPQPVIKFLSEIASKRKKMIIESELYRELVISILTSANLKVAAIIEEHISLIDGAQRGVMRDQMNYAEAEFDTLKSKQITNFRKTIESKFKDYKFCNADALCKFGNAIIDTNVVLFSSILRDMYSEIRQMIRVEFTKNGFAKMSIEAFTQHVEHTVNFNQSKVIDLFRSKIKEYDIAITFDDCYNESGVSALPSSMNSIFNKAREYSIQANKDITDIRAQMSKAVAAITLESELNLEFKKRVIKGGVIKESKTGSIELV